MNDTKILSIPPFVSSLIIICVAAVILFLLSSSSFKSEKDFLPASVGNILSASNDHILVKFKSDISSDQRNQILSKRNMKEKSEIKSLGVKIISIPTGKILGEVIDELKNNESNSIEFAEPDFLVEPSLIPNDPWYANWQKDKLQINLPQAWDTNTGSISATLAIVDTGVNCSHEDLVGQCMDGWNFYDNNNDTKDVMGHGTSVAGVAGAIGNNSVGVAGNTWQSKIMPIRVSALDGTATYSAIASAITYAADNGAKVVNASYQISGSQTIRDAAKYLKSKGGLLVASEGNFSSNTGFSNSPDIISVSAVDANDALYSWSSFGNDVDVAAPGCTGATTQYTGGYGSFCGTSNSAPEVSGLLMLIWSVNPGLTPDQVQSILFNSAKDLGMSGWDLYFGWGRVDSGKAIDMALSNNIVSSPTPTTTPTTGKTRRIPKTR
jgi:thermitase